MNKLGDFFELHGTFVYHRGHGYAFPGCLFSILAQVSFSATVRLNTGLPEVESGSAQKYPRRSNWQRVPAEMLASKGSAFAATTTSSEFGFRFEMKSLPSSA